MAKYSDIKGFTVQTVSTDPAASAAASGSWASGGDMNTTHAYAGGAGIQTAALVFAGVTPAQTANTESYDGTSWTEVNNMNQAAGYLESAGVVYTAALAIGGHRPDSPTAFTESWDGTNWTEVADLNSARSFAGSSGSATSALIYGGIDPSYPPHTGKTESWDGSSWTEVSDLNTVREGNTGFGVNNSNAISAGGGPGPTTVESWDGSSWTEVSEINTGRNGGAGFGAYDDGILCGGGPGGIANTEAWNGSSWTEVADLANARTALKSGYGCPSSVGIAFGGTSPPSSTYRAFTEEWTTSFTPTTLKKITEGQLFFNSTTNTFKETITDIPGTSWASGGSMNTARRGQRGTGSMTAGLVFGGGSPPPTVLTESYNGTAFTEVNDLNTGKNNGAGFGTQASTIATNEANVELWNGSSWTETTEVNTDRTSYAGATGPTSAGIVFGGYTSTYVANVETWNGSAWTEVNDLNNARSTGGGAGLNSGDAIAIMGDSNPYSNAYVETWDGTNWTEITQANTGRYYNGASGASSSSAITYGGYTTTAQNNTEVWNGSTWTEINNLATARFTGGSGNVGSTAASAFYAGGGFPDKTNMEEFSADNALATITVS